MKTPAELMALPDEELVSSFRETVIVDQHRLVNRLDHVAELDRRHLFYHYDSLRAFLIGEHGMEEARADRLIRIARIMRRHPEIREKLLLGKLNIKLIELIQGCTYREKLDHGQFLELIEAVSGKSCKAARREIASRYPRTANLPPDRIRPLSDEFSELRCVIRSQLEELIEETRGLLAHSHPGASLGEIIQVVFADFKNRHHPEDKARRAQARREKREKSKNPNGSDGPPAPARARPQNRKDARSFSEAQRQELTLAKGYRCSYRDPVTGKQCSSTFALEPDHVQPWSMGGATVTGNAAWLCRPHHARITYLQFGKFKPRPREPSS